MSALFDMSNFISLDGYVLRRVIRANANLIMNRDKNLVVMKDQCEDKFYSWSCATIADVCVRHFSPNRCLQLAKGRFSL